MEKLCSSARKLDTFFRVINTLLTIAAVACMAGLCIIEMGRLFRLAPEKIGKGYEKIDIGAIELTLTEDNAPDISAVMTQTSAELVMGIICLYIGKRCVKCVREILRPMAQGAPFHSAASANLRKLAMLSAIMGIAINCISLTSQYMAVHSFSLETLLLSEKISHVTISYSVDPGFLVITAVLLLLSYVFSYGEKLQQLSDETL